MSNSSTEIPKGFVRSAAVISLGLVGLAGSVVTLLARRVLSPSTRSAPAAPQVSKLVTDEWQADLERLNLPTRTEVQAMYQQLSALEAQIDQLLPNQPHDE